MTKLYNNENYEIVTGFCDDYERDGYWIVNKVTGITEVQCMLWPQAKNYAQQLNRSIIEDELDLIDTPNIATLQ